MPTNVALTGPAKELAVRADSRKPIHIGLIGSGEMGTDVVTRVYLISGIEVAAIADVHPENAVKAVATAFQEHGHAQIVHWTKGRDAAIEAKKIAVGAEVGIKAMERGKHLIMMNVEADVTIGAYLKSQADKNGVVYALGAGDAPTACMGLIEFVSAMGHKVVAAGKGKNNPLNFDVTPDAYADEAQRRNMNTRMLVEFVDGAKTMVEVAAIANATGLVPDKSGMHGTASSIDQLSEVLVPTHAGGILSDVGRVDFSIGKGVTLGVFVVAEMDHPRVMERMEDLKMGKGPYFTFSRPYHLTSLEVPLSCAKAVLHGRSDMVPLSVPVAEVCALAKKDHQVGEILDQIGEYSYRACVMEVHEARALQAIPCGLLAGSKVLKTIRKGELLTYKNTAPSKDSKIVQLRLLQDQMIFGNWQPEEING